jgi:hypothetical protein
MSRLVAERILRSLGIEEPREIDLEAIAWHLGVVSVRRRELDGCEARIVGKGDRAIISIDPRQMRRRQRFSIGHELGHWIFHRGKSTFCRTEDIGEIGAGRGDEQSANQFAADLLLPEYLLRPISRRHPKLTVKIVREVADQSDTTQSATVIRMAELGEHPILVVCHDLKGRHWFARSPLIPSRWFPQGELHHDSYAFDLLHGTGAEQTSPRRIPADAYFDRWDANRFEVEEQSSRVADGEIITIISFRNEMLEDR